MLSIPIVVVAYNRTHSLRRLLSSLDSVHFAFPVKLIISIDGGGSDDVVQLADAFEWKHGTKELIVHEENLGLRRHILSCGDISRNYDGIILLEDDLYVSPWFYQFTLAAIGFYKDSKEICGISLYAYQYNETALLPFKPLNDGTDVYFMQLPCSWGQAWLKEHWTGFKEWYDLNCDITLQGDLSLPANIEFWSDNSWKKYFMKYMVESTKFFVYPRISYATNFGDKGQHLDRDMNVFQTPLAMGDMETRRFMNFVDCLVKYDVFCELLPECFHRLSRGALPNDLSIDLYGTKRIENLSSEYILTSKKCKANEDSFALQMLPHEMNIISRVPGDDLFLARLDDLVEFVEINQLIFSKVVDEAQLKYYFCADDVHFNRMRDLENRLFQSEAKVKLSFDSVELPKRLLELVTSLRECQGRIYAMESSLSWRITKVLRWFGDRLGWKK